MDTKRKAARPFVYMATDEAARFRWLSDVRTKLVRAESDRCYGASNRDLQWALEYGVVSSDTITVKAQLATHGTRRQLRARVDGLSRCLERLGREFGVVFRLFDRTTSTTYEYRVYAADPDQFRTIRLTGKAARVAQALDDYVVTGVASKRLLHTLDMQLEA